MVNVQSLSDQLELEALPGRFTDAVMMNDHDRLASLFVPEGRIRIPDAGLEVNGADQIRALGIQREARHEVFVQNTHPGVIEIDGDHATGRAYLSELVKSRDGRSHLNYAIYHDSYRRTDEGWRFVERRYEIKYLDTSPLPGGPSGRLGPPDSSTTPDPS